MIFMSVCLFWGKYNNKISLGFKALFQLGSVAQSCPALYDPMDCGMPGFPGHHQLPELAQTHVHPTIHFILCCPLVLLPSVFPSIRVFSNESVLHIRWPKYWSFSFSTSPSNEYSRLISFRMDWLDLLTVQGTLKSLLQHHSSKASILWWSVFFLEFPHSSVSKESACNAGGPGSIPEWERSAEEGNGNPLQYSCQENLMDRGAWWATVHGITRVRYGSATKPPPIFFMVQLSHPYTTTGKTIALTIWTFVYKVMSLLFNMLSRLVIAFLSRSKCLLISCLQWPSAVILEPKKIKSLTVSPSIGHEVMWPDAMILVSLMFSASFFFLLFHLHQVSSVPFHFLPLAWCHLHIWSYWYFSW